MHLVWSKAPDARPAGAATFQEVKYLFPWAGEQELL